MSEDRGRGECFFERIESIMTGGVELPRNVILDGTCQWIDNGHLGSLNNSNNFKLTSFCPSTLLLLKLIKHNKLNY